MSELSTGGRLMWARPINRRRGSSFWGRRCLTVAPLTGRRCLTVALYKLFYFRTAIDMKNQIELVDTLEHRLSKERNKLQAMMQHLQMKHSPDTTTPTVGKIEPASPMRSPKQEMVSPTQTHPPQQLQQPQPALAAVQQPQQLSPTVTAVAVTTAAPIQVGHSHLFFSYFGPFS